MSVPIPKIDDLSFTQLREAVVSEIPQLVGDSGQEDTQWVDHNPSDIGIATLELLAAMAESVVFRADQITPEIERNFLRLVLDRPEPVTAAARFVRQTPSVSPAPPPPATLPSQVAGLLQFVSATSTLSSTRSFSEIELTILLAFGTLAFKAAIIALNDSWQRQVTIYPGMILGSAGGGREFETLTAATTRPGELSVDTVIRHRSVFDQLPHITGSAFTLGIATGEASQKFALPTRSEQGDVWPVLLDDNNLGPEGFDPNPRLRIVPPLTSGALPETWLYVPDFLQADETDSVFTVGLVTYELRFGDGERGRLPIPGSTVELIWLQRVEDRNRQRDVTALSLIVESHTPWESLTAPQATIVNAQPSTAYDSQAQLIRQTAPMTLAERTTLSGVIPGDPIWIEAIENLYEVSNLRFGSPLDPPASIGTQALVALGGRFLFDADNAERAGLAVLLERERAISAADYEYLAQHGFNAEVVHNNPAIARAHALRTDQAGSISVVIIPAGNPGDQAPMPTIDLMERLHHYLDQRRLITTRLFVRAPDYVDVVIAVDAVSRNVDDTLALRTEIETTLMRFFHPLSGGDDGRGWPLGRALYRADVFRLLHGIDDVDHINRVVLGTGGQRDFFAIDPLQLPRVERSLLTVTVTAQ